MNFIIYITYYDEHSYQRAMTNFGKYLWAKLVKLSDHNNLYLENEMYLNVLETRKEEWINCDFVGALSYKIFDKIGYFDIPSIISQNVDKDIITFYAPIEYRKKLLFQAMYCHPLFENIWTSLLALNGFRISTILSEDIDVFFCNYWVATPKWMKKYMEFQCIMKKTIEDNLGLQQLMMLDSQYYSKPHSLDLFGVPYYPYHPFVFERLICFFAYIHKLNIYIRETRLNPMFSN